MFKDLLSAFSNLRPVAISFGIGISLIAQSAFALECDAPLDRAALTNAIATGHPEWFQNIPVDLREQAAEPTSQQRRCEFYRAASGMDGALCIDIEPDRPAADAVFSPAGSFGDNQVDRVVEFVLSAASNTLECENARTVLSRALVQDFVPVETNSPTGQVCVRDVLRPPFLIDAQADVLDSNGAEISDVALAQSTPGCFELAAALPAGAYPVTRFEVTTFDGQLVDLGMTSPLFIEGVASTTRAWFVDADDNGLNLGSFESPFQSFSALNSAQGSENGPAIGDLIFIAGGEFDEPVRLLDRQWILGTGTDWLQRLAEAGITPPAGLDSSTAPNGSTKTSLRAFGAGPFAPAPITPIELANDNQVFGFNISCPDCFGLDADNLGSLTVRETSFSGAGVIRIVDTHADVEIESFDSVSNNRAQTPRGSIFLENTTGSFTVLGLGDEQSEVSGGLGILFINAENVSLNRVRAHLLTVREVTNFSLTNSTIILDEPRFSPTPASGLVLSNVWGNLVLSGTNIVDEGGGSEVSKTNLTMENSSGSVSALIEDMLIVGRLTTGSTFFNDFDRLFRVSASGDARVDLLVRNATLQHSQFAGAEFVVADTADLNVTLEDVGISNFEKRFVDPALRVASFEGDADIEEDFRLQFQMRDTAANRGSGESSTSFIRNPGAIGMLFDFTTGMGQVDIDVSDSSVRALPINGVFLAGHQPMVVRSGADIQMRMRLSESELWSAIDGGALVAESAGSLDLTLQNNRTFGEFSGFGLDLSLAGSAAAPADLCLDPNANTFVAWDPTNGDIAQFASDSASSLRLAGYAGSSSGEALGGNASTDIFDWLIERGNTPFTFNDDLVFSVSAQSLPDISSTDACSLPQFDER